MCRTSHSVENIPSPKIVGSIQGVWKGMSAHKSALWGPNSIAKCPSMIDIKNGRMSNRAFLDSYNAVISSQVSCEERLRINLPRGS